MPAMRRVFGTTGVPEEIPQLTANQLPILDLSDADVASALVGRTVYVNLWVYVTGDAPETENVVPPSFWENMVTKPYEQLYYPDPSPIPNPTYRPMIYAMTSTESPLEDACGDVDHVFAVEAGAYILSASAVNSLQPLSTGNVSCLQPTQILTNYPMTGGQRLYVIHNLNPATTSVYAWGYYVIQDFEGTQVENRPLQPTPTEVNTSFSPVIIEAPDTTTVHAVSDDFTDEITLDWRICGVDGAANTGGANRVNLIIENGPTIPLYSGMTLDNTFVGFTGVSRFFDGIPMKGAGNIQFELTSGPGAIQVTGSFKRY